MELVKAVCIRDVVFKDSVEFDENGYLIKESLEIDFIKEKEYVFLKDKDKYTSINEYDDKHIFNENDFRIFFKEIYSVSVLKK